VGQPGAMSEPALSTRAALEAARLLVTLCDISLSRSENLIGSTFSILRRAARGHGLAPATEVVKFGRDKPNGVLDRDSSHVVGFTIEAFPAGPTPGSLLVSSGNFSYHVV